VLNEKTAITTKLTSYSTAASAAAANIWHKVLTLFKSIQLKYHYLVNAVFENYTIV